MKDLKSRETQNQDGVDNATRNGIFLLITVVVLGATWMSGGFQKFSFSSPHAGDFQEVVSERIELETLSPSQIEKLMDEIEAGDLSSFKSFSEIEKFLNDACDKGHVKACKLIEILDAIDDRLTQKYEPTKVILREGFHPDFIEVYNQVADWDINEMEKGVLERSFLAEIKEVAKRKSGR